MNIFNNHVRGLSAKLSSVGAIVAVSGLLAGAVHAQPVTHDAALPSAGASPVSPGQGVSVQYGWHSKYQRFGLAYETPALWSHSFTNNGRVDLSLELGAGYWSARKDREPDSMWQLSAVPMVRWWPSDTYYLEIGVGPSYMSRTNFAGKEISTKFQFTSHVGGGFVFNEVHRLGLRYTHVSNASIKTPNPGLDLIEASYTYQF